jgi:prepilin-type N-terminal cleavage/methylation domain-containing protein
MLKMLRNRIQDDKGFTLIELMVVVLIIAILIAIAIPTFLGLRERAQDRAAQAELRDGLTAAKAFYTDDETFTGFTPGDAGTAEAVEPSLTWGAAGSETVVGIYVLDGGDSVVLTRQSESDNGGFCAMDSGSESSVRGPVAAEPATVAACTAGDEV